MSARPGPDEGPLDVAEEVARLADAVQAWWTSAQGPAWGSAPGQAAPDRSDRQSDHDTDHSGQADEAGQTDETGHADRAQHADRSHRADQAEHADRAEHPDQTEYADQTEHADHHDAHRGPHEAPTGSCRICPLCRALDLLRGVRPELLQQVATAAETVAVLLREAAAGDPRGRDADPPPAADEGRADGHDGHDSDDSDVTDAPHRGTRILVTDAPLPPARHGDEPAGQDEGGRRAWA